MLTVTRCAGLIIAGVIVAAGAAGPAHATGASKGASEASGEFTAAIDFGTLALERLPGKRCRLTVDGTLTFTGTLQGTATGTTTATVYAPCDDVQITSPGTFRDTFRFDGTFDGTVDGTATTAPLTYFGVTAPGGEIRAAIHVKGDRSRAYLRAQASIAEDGVYTGVAIDCAP